MNNGIIYLDHSATTYVDSQVAKAMEPFFSREYYNPSSLYTPARKVAEEVSKARGIIARRLGADSEKEIIFTSSGSEGDNTAIFGIAFACRDRGKHIITSAVEHPAVLNTVKGMERFGFEYTLIPVDEYGTVRMDELKGAIRKDTVLITIMAANNEVGTIQPLEEIGRLASSRGIFFHTDAVQAVGSVDLNVNRMNISALTIAGHKFYGPKGVGALYLREGVPFDSLMKGGHQEDNRRAGTHNTPGIIGLGKAMELACDNREENSGRIRLLRDRLVKGILEKIPQVTFNGHPENRLPNNANFCFKYVDSEAVLLHLDMLGICASGGSACSSGSEGPSHVLSAMGIAPEVARGSLRLSLGNGTTGEEIDYVLEKLPGVIDKLREMSPFSVQAE